MLVRTLEADDSWGTADLEETLSLAAARECSTIIVDSDNEGAYYLRRLRNASYFVVAIEDNAPHPLPCHLVVNGDAHARGLSYHSTFEDTKFLLGPEYSILRREFWKIPKRVVLEDVDNILVTFGSSDPYNIMPKVIDLLDKLPPTFSVSAIIGPFFENLAEVQTAAQHARRAITLIKSPDSVRALMLQAGLAISAGGQTLYELACVGCPTVAVRLAANQDGQLAVFEEAGFLRMAGHGNHGGIVEVICDTIKILLADPQARAAMSEAGQHFVDGQGALRVAQAIVELANGL
jgi:spore coat polysaccharide biosynthesis predicted glycosyltransferase SpsG